MERFIIGLMVCYGSCGVAPPPEQDSLNQVAEIIYQQFVDRYPTVRSDVIATYSAQLCTTRQEYLMHCPDTSVGCAYVQSRQFYVLGKSWDCSALLVFAHELMHIVLGTYGRGVFDHPYPEFSVVGMDNTYTGESQIREKIINQLGICF